jgi:hypothetical protein
MYRATMLASLQYMPTQGALADTWLTAYILAHGPLGTNEVEDHESNGHSLSVVDPPHEEGCTSQLDLTYHWAVSDQDRYTEIFDGVKAAIYYAEATPYAEAACDSTFQ